MIVYPNLKRPEPGQPVKASWGDSVIAAIKSITPVSGKNVRLTRTNTGTIIDVDFKSMPIQNSISGDINIDDLIDQISGDVIDVLSNYYLTGVTDTVNIVEGMTYNSTNHKFDFQYRTAQFTNGLLTNLGAAQTSTVFTAVGESY